MGLVRELVLERLRFEQAMVRLAAVSPPHRVHVYLDEVERRSERMSPIDAWESVYQDVIAGRLT